MKNKPKPIQLGDTVECKLTQFRGVAMAKLEWVSGGVQYIVQPTVDDNGNQRSSAYVDAALLQKVPPKEIGYRS